MTAQGSPLTRFRRAIQHRSLLLAIAAAREHGWLDLSDALSLVELMAAQHDDLFERAALRWHARFELEVPGAAHNDDEVSGLTASSSHLPVRGSRRCVTRLFPRCKTNIRKGRREGYPGCPFDEYVWAGFSSSVSPTRPSRRMTSPSSFAPHRRSPWPHLRCSSRSEAPPSPWLEDRGRAAALRPGREPRDR